MYQKDDYSSLPRSVLVYIIIFFIRISTLRDVKFLER